MSTREPTNIIVGMLATDSILRIENMPGSVPGLYNKMPQSVNFAMGVCMLAPRSIEWYRSSAANIVQSTRDPDPNLIQILTEDLLANGKHATVVDPKSDRRGREWHPTTVFTMKPEKLLLEGIAAGFHKNEDYQNSVDQLLKIFPGNDRSSMRWRQKIFKAKHSPLADQTIGGMTCFEADRLYYEKKDSQLDALEFPGIYAEPNDSSLFARLKIRDYPTHQHEQLWLR